ncbi:MAG: CBS domain-containing protein, partial [Candidatus Micrarchaeota archaeon]
MLPDVSEIKPRRLKLGLNQSQLAFTAGVSQSLIAKLEAGKIDASYSKTKRLFETLEKIENQTQLKAKDAMREKIASVNPQESVRKAVDSMRSHGYSQLPVIEKGNCVGSVSEKTVL